MRDSSACDPLFFEYADACRFFFFRLLRSASFDYKKKWTRHEERKKVFYLLWIHLTQHRKSRYADWKCISREICGFVWRFWHPQWESRHGRVAREKRSSRAGNQRRSHRSLLLHFFCGEQPDYMHESPHSPHQVRKREEIWKTIPTTTKQSHKHHEGNFFVQKKCVKVILEEIILRNLDKPQPGWY